MSDPDPYAPSNRVRLLQGKSHMGPWRLRTFLRRLVARWLTKRWHRRGNGRAKTTARKATDSLTLGPERRRAMARLGKERKAFDDWLNLGRARPHAKPGQSSAPVPSGGPMSHPPGSGWGTFSGRNTRRQAIAEARVNPAPRLARERRPDPACPCCGEPLDPLASMDELTGTLLCEECVDVGYDPADFAPGGVHDPARVDGRYSPPLDPTDWAADVDHPDDITEDDYLSGFEPR